MYILLFPSGEVLDVSKDTLRKFRAKGYSREYDMYTAMDVHKSELLGLDKWDKRLSSYQDIKELDKDNPGNKLDSSSKILSNGAWIKRNSDKKGHYERDELNYVITRITTAMKDGKNLRQIQPTPTPIGSALQYFNTYTKKDISYNTVKMLMSTILKFIPVTRGKKIGVSQRFFDILKKNQLELLQKYYKANHLKLN